MTQSIINILFYFLTDKTDITDIYIFLYQTMTDKEFLNNWFNLDCSKEGQNLVILNLDNQLDQNIPDIYFS